MIDIPLRRMDRPQLRMKTTASVFVCANIVCGGGGRSGERRALGLIDNLLTILHLIN